MNKLRKKGKKGKSPQTAPLSAATPLQSSSSTCEWLNWPTMFICWSQLLSPWLSSFASWSWWQSLSRCWCWPLHIPRPGSLRTADRSPCYIPPPAKSFIKVLFWLFWWSSMIMIDTMNIWRCSWQRRYWRGKWSWIVDLWRCREVNFWS